MSLQFFSRFESVSFRAAVQDVTIELQDSKYIMRNNTNYLIKTNVTVILAHPPLNQFVCYTMLVTAIFPPKATTTVCLDLYFFCQLQYYKYSICYRENYTKTSFVRFSLIIRKNPGFCIREFQNNSFTISSFAEF